MARQIAHQMRVDGKHLPPAGSPMQQQRLPAMRPGCYPEHAPMVSASWRKGLLDMTTKPALCFVHLHCLALLAARVSILHLHALHQEV